jgi:hypothetical protein
MFKSFIKKCKKRLEAQNFHFDPASISDPLAQQTGWTGLKRGGSRSKTRKLVQVNPNRVEFKVSYLHVASFAILFLVGLYMVGLSLYPFFKSGNFAEIGKRLLYLIAGLCLAGFSVWKVISKASPVVFDRASGYFFKGRKSPRQMMPQQDKNNFIPLHKIGALQILSEYISYTDDSYYSYELNLVLKDGKRINITDHNNLKHLKQDAVKLSEFLDVPVWDASNRE